MPISVLIKGKVHPCLRLPPRPAPGTGPGTRPSTCRRLWGVALAVSPLPCSAAAAACRTPALRHAFLRRRLRLAICLRQCIVSLVFHLLGGGPWPRTPELFTISAVLSLINSPPLSRVAPALFTCQCLWETPGLGLESWE